MGLPQKQFRLPLCQSFILRYAIFATTCLIFLFLGAVYCLLSCQLSSCDEGGRCVIGGMFGVLKSGSTTPKLSSFLVVLVLTSASNMERRVTIRQTWLKDVRSDVLHLFAIGESVMDDDERRTLKSEIARFQDILFLSNVNDSYSSLTAKLLHSLKWIDENVDFRFLLKTDDDTFARIDDIVYELESLAIKNRLYWGFFNGKARVYRNGKWSERDYVLCDNYLPYALGGGYVLSSDMVRYVAKNMEYLKHYRSEDVSMGTWLASVDVRRVHDPRFDTEYRSRGCFNSYLVTHKQSIDQMREKFWLLQEKGHLCSTEQRTRLSYEYNWKGPPSQCCIRNDSKIP